LDARELTWPEIKALADDKAVALLPIGSIEAHGPHLPLSTDIVIAEEVCKRVERALAAQGRASVRFAPIAYGVTDFASGFVGTVTLEAAVFEPYLRQVVESIARQGFSTVCLVNHHLEPAHFKQVHAAAKAAAENTQASVKVADHRRGARAHQLGAEFLHGGSHAGFYETSLMLAAAPQWVRGNHRSLPDVERDLPALIKAGKKSFEACDAPDAYMGSPRSASVEAGEEFYSVLVQVVLETLGISAG